MKRAVIIGATGSGKTTLAKKLSEKKQLSFIDLDELHWLPGWVERADADFRQIVTQKIQEGDSWTISGNYSQVRDIIWASADTVIWLDYSFLRNFQQLFYRSIRRIINKELVCNGNIETWRQTFLTKNSILWWLLKTFHKRRRVFGDVFSHPERYPHLRFIRLQSPKQTKEWLESL